MLSVLILGVLAAAALLLARARSSPSAAEVERRDAARALLLAAGVQGLHFVEEAATGFHQRFPGLFGLPEYPFPVFAAFNLACLAVWIAVVPGLRSGRRFAFFAAWFLAIAGVANGIAHPLFAVAVAGYFPGLVTSPFVCAASAVLWLRLRRATEAPIQAPPALRSR